MLLDAAGDRVLRSLSESINIMSEMEAQGHQYRSSHEQILFRFKSPPN
jgi:hypothetical protein